MTRTNQLAYLVRVVLVVLLLWGGYMGYRMFAAMAKPPATEEPEEAVIRALSRRLSPEDATVVLTGFGSLRARRRSIVSAEVGGRVIELHPRLEVGNLIPSGEVLLEIDPRDYQLAVRQASAELERLGAQLAQLEQEHANNQRQLAIACDSRDLARKEMDRFRELLAEGATSETNKERAETQFNLARQTVVQLESALALYPSQLRMARAALAGAREALAKADLSLSRTTLTAPFDARVADKRVEVEQIVAPGTPLFTLVDDSVLEIVVPLDGEDVKRWLLDETSRRPGWFGTLPERPVEIAWTQDETTRATGELAHVEDYDPTTRTVRLVCRLRQPGGLLSEGMFCRVAIPGKLLRGVYRLPRRAVTHEGDVILVVDGRMRKVRVSPLYRQGEDVLVSGPIAPGDLAILEPPTRVIEGQRVQPVLEGDEEPEAPS